MRSDYFGLLPIDLQNLLQIGDQEWELWGKQSLGRFLEQVTSSLGEVALTFRQATGVCCGMCVKSEMSVDLFTLHPAILFRRWELFFYDVHDESTRVYDALDVTQPRKEEEKEWVIRTVKAYRNRR